MYPRILNRSVAIVTIKEPCLTWLNSFLEESQHLSLEFVNQDKIVYLLPEYYTPHELDFILEDMYPTILQYTLSILYRVQSVWPPMTQETFREWFDIEVHSVAIDVCTHKLGVTS